MGTSPAPKNPFLGAGDGVTCPWKCGDPYACKTVKLLVRAGSTGPPPPRPWSLISYNLIISRASLFLASLILSPSFIIYLSPTLSACGGSGVRRPTGAACGGRWVLRVVGVTAGGPLDLPSAAGADGWTSCGLEFLVIEFYLSTWFLGNEVLLDFLVIVENESEQRMKVREQLILIDELCTIYTHRTDRIASWRHPFGMVGSPCCNYIFT